VITVASGLTVGRQIISLNTNESDFFVNSTYDGFFEKVAATNGTTPFRNMVQQGKLLQFPVFPSFSLEAFNMTVFQSRGGNILLFSCNILQTSRD